MYNDEIVMIKNHPFGTFYTRNEIKEDLSGFPILSEWVENNFFVYNTASGLKAEKKRHLSGITDMQQTLWI